MTYLLVKWLHILSSTLLFGTGLGSAFYLYFTSRTHNPQAIAVVAHHVVIADWIFTTPTIILQPLTGLYLMHLAGMPLATPWILWSVVLYLLAAAAWLPVVWMQIRMRDMAAAAANSHGPLSQKYWQLLRIWVALGVVAFFFVGRGVLPHGREAGAMILRSLLVGLLWVMFGVWLLAGLGDWLCHRRSQIQRSAGPTESALHLLLYLLIAAPIVVVLFMEINATVLVFMATCVLAHMAVSLWDTSFAQPRRHISPLEQQIHSYLEMLPLFAVTLAVVLHWEASVDPEWGWSLRLHPLPAGWRPGVLLALLFGLLLIVEELLRCLRATPRSPRS